MYKEDNLLITGFAQLPRGTTLYEKNKIIGVVMVINETEKIIEDVEFTFVAKLTNEYLTSIVKGYNFSNGMDELYDKIRKYCILPSQGAIIQALRSAWDRYTEHKKNINNR